VGRVDGERLGLTVGILVAVVGRGDTVGRLEGFFEGSGVGFLVGRFVEGLLVFCGFAVSVVGDFVGFEVFSGFSAFDGFSVGTNVGLWLGVALGTLDGTGIS
jgi:hypothetical protein